MNTDQSYTPEPMPCPVATRRRRISIGLPAAPAGGDRRFPLTPEGVRQMTDNGFEVVVETNAAAPIHYTDARYTRAGARIAPRAEALAADMVLMLDTPALADVASMRRGAMLLSLASPLCRDAAVARAMLDRHIISVALDLVGDPAPGGVIRRPFADILAEVDGRASMAMACSMLSHPSHGKGILLGGVIGVIPCEVLVVGSNIGARAAAASAIGMGATVRMLDNDAYGLRAARAALGDGVATSTLHAHVLEGALRTADVVISAGCASSNGFTVDADQVALMKKGIIVMDLDYDHKPTFPSLPAIDISTVTTYDAPKRPHGGRICYIRLGNSVPRTAAMALSDTLIAMMRHLVDSEGASALVRMLPGVQAAVCTFLGKPVNPRISALVGARPIDIALLLSCS